MRKPVLATKLATRLARLEAAKVALAEEAYRAQQRCEHAFCYETPVQFLEYFTSLMPLRICAFCRLEEEGTIHSGNGIWSKKDYEPSAFKKSVVLKSLDRDAFYALRLPVLAKAPLSGGPGDARVGAC